VKPGASSLVAKEVVLGQIVLMKRSRFREDENVVFILMFHSGSNLNREDIHIYGSCQCMNQYHTLFKEGK
jgi:hypothetical protein